MIDLYLKYCRVLFERYKGKVKYWITFNEIFIYVDKDSRATAPARTRKDSFYWYKKVIASTARTCLFQTPLALLGGMAAPGHPCVRTNR